MSRSPRAVGRMWKWTLTAILVAMAFAAILTAPTLNMLKAKAAKAKEAEKPPMVVIHPSQPTDPLAPPPQIPAAKKYPI